MKALILSWVDELALRMYTIWQTLTLKGGLILYVKPWESMVSLRRNNFVDTKPIEKIVVYWYFFTIMDLQYCLHLHLRCYANTLETFFVINWVIEPWGWYERTKQNTKMYIWEKIDTRILQHHHHPYWLL